MKITYFNDGGHGWYSVKRDFLSKHNLLKEVSGYSYQKNNMIYLEEDSDARLLFDKLKELNIVPVIKSSYKERSPVRNYESFQVEQFKKCGFDLTDFGSDIKFISVLNQLDISTIPYQEEDGHPFKWIGDQITIETCNNPIDGTYWIKDRRKNEVGYASYIGIQGEKSRVEKAFNLILKNAAYVKGYDKNERSFI